MRKKRIVAWTAAGIISLVLLLVVAGDLVLRSSAFHNFLRSKVESIASRKLGTRVNLKALDLHLSDLSADLYGITVSGKEPGSPPLLQADHVGVDLQVISVLRRKWNLNSISIDHPVARIVIDQRGNSNLPMPTASSGPQTNIFDLAIKNAVLNRGEIYYNDQKTPLYADLHDLHFQSAYSALDGGHYSGTLAYRNGTLRFDNYSPLPHNLEANFDASRSALKLSPVKLSVEQSRLELAATLQDYSNPNLQFTYRANLEAGEFRKTLNNPSIPSGAVLLSGNGEYKNQASASPLQGLTLNGQMSSSVLAMDTPQFHGLIRNVSAQYSATEGNAAIRGLRAELLGGNVDATLTVRDLAGERQSQLDARLRDISTGDLQSLVAFGSVKDIRVAGATNATVKASWKGALQDLVATAEASVRAQALPQGPGSVGASGMPVDANVTARYVAAKKQISLSRSYIHLPQTSLDVNGTVSERSSLEIALHSTNLHELEIIANAFRRSPDGGPVQPIGLYGTASFTGTLQGSTAAPRLQGQLSASNLRIRETSWRVLRANLQASPSLLSVQNGNLEPAQQGHIAFALKTELQRWSFAPTSQFDLTLNASHLNTADLARLANSPGMASGTLNANIAMHGTEQNPFGRGTVVLANGNVIGEPVQAVTLSFQGTGNEIRGALGGRLPAGSAISNFTFYPKAQNYDVMLQVASLQLEKLQTIQRRHMNLSGALDITASGRGSLKNPSLVLNAQIPALRFQEQTIRGLKLQANVEQHVATLDMTSEAVNTGLRAHGTVGLTDGYQADLRIDTGPIPLEPLLATYAPQASDVTGQTELHATLRGPLKNRYLLEMHAQMPTLSLQYQNFQIAATRPVLIDYARGVLSVQRSEIRGPETDLQFQGSFPVRSNEPASLLLLGAVDLRILSILEPDLRSSGQIQFDINSVGERTNPNLQGKIRVVNANISTIGSPAGLQNANGLLTLNNRRVDITSFQGQIGGGTITARGGVVIRPNIIFDLAATGNGLTLLYPRGIRSVSDADLTFTGTPKTAMLRGTIRVDHLAFTPDFDLSAFASQFSDQIAAPPSAGFANNVQLQVVLQTGTGLNLVSRTLSLQGGANLRLVGTAAAPVVLGRADVTGGDVIFLANRYVIQGGSVAFVNPTRTEPVVNISATTTINQYNINLRLEGPADRLRTTYSSDPSLPPVDIINLLAFGKTTEAQTASANTGGTLGPESVLASGISSQIAGRIQKIAGISQLSIDPVLGPNQGTQGARISIQQRVTSSLFVTFSSDVTSTQYQTIQIQYQLNPRWSLTTDRDQNGGFGFTARYHKSF